MEMRIRSHLIGMAVVHEDLDPGVITEIGNSICKITFCSGYLGNFPPESIYGSTSVFVWFPLNYDSHSEMGEPALDTKLKILSKISALIDEDKEEECRQFCKELNIESWFPESGLNALARSKKACPSHARELADIILKGSLSDVYYFYHQHWLGITPHELTELCREKARVRMARLGIPLSDEQELACIFPARNRLITARAGAGKTHTLAALANLIIQDECLDPNQILTLAFNTKAAEEIGNRISSLGGLLNYANARTFHSLAWKLARPSRKLIFDDGNLQPSLKRQSQFVERVIHEVLDNKGREQVYEFFRRELDQVDRLGSMLVGEEYFMFRRGIAELSLAGHDVKSKGEKYIADFLFEHDIAYEYERVYSWKMKHQGSPYRPDFTLKSNGRTIILEHWAIDPDDVNSQVPSWWKTSTKEYRCQIQDKREYWQEQGIVLLETNSKLTSSRESFEKNLKAMLEGHGVLCRLLPRSVLLERVAKAPRTISRLASLFLAFISRAKKRGWSLEQTSAMISQNPDPEPRARFFHQLALRAYSAYEELLQSEGACDFDDLLKLAKIEVDRLGSDLEVRLNHKDSIRLGDLRWILIDEFQDFSELYFRLLSAIRGVNPKLRIVAVGDDWQAINGFAGAQLKFFQKFGYHFDCAGTCFISVNRRSDKIIVNAGNKIMENRGQPAISSSNKIGMIDIKKLESVWIDDKSDQDDLLYSEIIRPEDGSKPSPQDFIACKAIKACVDYMILGRFSDEKGVHLPSTLILSRTGIAYGRSLAKFEQELILVLKRHSALQGLASKIHLEVLTVHRAKGKEASSVIILDARAKNFPKVHADNQLYEPFGFSAADGLAEERRLFYVAITRAKNRLLFLTEHNQESPFISEIGVMAAKSRGPVAPIRSQKVRLGEKAREIEAYLGNIGRLSMIRYNITRAALSVLDRLMSRGLDYPEVGITRYGSTAELAWINERPPIAVLTGRHKLDAKVWEAHGWVVIRA